MLFQQSVNKIKIIKICIYLIVLALIFKVGYIQIIDRKNIYDKALESWQRSFPVQANRGKIYDRSGNVLATDLTTASLVVVPSQIKDQATTALELSKILNVDVNVLKEKLNEQVVVAKFESTTKHGAIEDKTQTGLIDYFNLNYLFTIAVDYFVAIARYRK